MFESFEKKVVKIKKNLGEHKVGIIYFMFFTVCVFFSMVLLKNFRLEKQSVQDGYNRALYDFVSDVNNVESSIVKLRITNNDEYALTTLASIFGKANTAKANLDILPFSAESTSNASKFLSQLSDFAYSLMRNIMNGEGLEEYKEEIDTIYEKVSELSNVSEEIYADLTNGRINWDELQKQEGRFKQDTADEELSSVNKIGKTFIEYEGIIYDGAFSDHILNKEPALLTDNEISKEEAEKTLRNKFSIDSINFKEEQAGRLALYVFEMKLVDEEQEKTVYVTKRDGLVYQMVSDRKVEKEIISMDEATNKAKEFLGKLGIENLASTYYLKNENMALVSFAAMQDDVMIYSDLIKVKVCLDNGEIASFEANGYINNHKVREINPTKTAEEARETLYPEINVVNERLCIIPTDTKEEVLVYEFKGEMDDKVFLVYINAQTLRQEDVYILLETPGGILTI